MKSMIFKVSALVMLLSSLSKSIFCDEIKIAYAPIKSKITTEKLIDENSLKKFDYEKMLKDIEKYDNWSLGLGPLSFLGEICDKYDSVKDKLQKNLKKDINSNWKVELYGNGFEKIGVKVTRPF